MSISLRQVYEDTKNLYQLKLVAGENGLDNIMSWLYMSEDYTTYTFLNGNELIITTGAAILGAYDTDTKLWLITFIKNLISKGTCGLIINVGKYILEADIDKEIRDLCDSNNFPLLTMPWEIRLNSISHDYYNRIFEDTRRQNRLTEGFEHILNTNTVNEAMLKDSGFEHGSYCVCYIQSDKAGNTLVKADTDYFSSTDLTINQLVINCLTKLHAEKNIHPHTMKHEDGYLLLLCCDDAAFLKEALNYITTTINEDPLSIYYHIGIGRIFTSLTELNRNVTRARLTSDIAKQRDLPAIFYTELGFTGLILEIEDKTILNDFVNDRIGILIDYDKHHSSELTETLYQYLIASGSIKRVASEMFIHRNTVNYRIGIIKELLNNDLSDALFTFELLCCYHILRN